MTKKIFSIKLPSVAKINPYLEVGQKDDNGLHQLNLGFQFLDFADEMIFTLQKKKMVLDYVLPVKKKEDLCFLAIQILKKTKSYQKRKRDKLAYGIKIQLKKNIPFGSGLGGGSSNAATTLMALNILWDLKLSNEELCRIGFSLGSDVPIFIYGRAAKATRYGEIFQEYFFREKEYLLLYPNISVSTAKVFNHPLLKKRNKFSQFDNENYFHNDCLEVTFLLYPEVKKAYQFLSTFGKVLMSGTGSSLLLDLSHSNQDEVIERIQTKLKLIKKELNSNVDNWSLYRLKSLNKSPVNIKLAHY